MNTTEKIDDITLAAFVDGELDPSGCERVMRAMETDPQVRARVDALRRAGDLMRLGFGHARAPVRSGRRNNTRQARPFAARWVAALALVVSTLVAGVFGFQAGKELGMHAQTSTASDDAAARQHVVLHVDRSGPEPFAAAIEYTRRFVASQSADSRIAVVAHAGGLDMVREDVSQFRDEINALISNNDNVYFIACANSIRMLRDSGVEPRFIDQVDTSKPAFDQIVSRLKAGWSYVKIDELTHI